MHVLCLSAFDCNIMIKISFQDTIAHWHSRSFKQENNQCNAAT